MHAKHRYQNSLSGCASSFFLILIDSMVFSSCCCNYVYKIQKTIQLTNMTMWVPISNYPTRLYLIVYVSTQYLHKCCYTMSLTDYNNFYWTVFFYLSSNMFFLYNVRSLISNCSPFYLFFFSFKTKPIYILQVFHICSRYSFPNVDLGLLKHSPAFQMSLSYARHWLVSK